MSQCWHPAIPNNPRLEFLRSGNANNMLGHVWINLCIPTQSDVFRTWHGNNY